ncbi:CRISPR-associated helicase Cas3' [Gephyromycinifex aptenodytis]|uniref:CRISPR-associated helicase Cas3' n=1 Tax=Gephyromycinifex aptenodytis TaxID=2716227 RepID=UPI001444BE29|nr:CRISPR-associated helicase Cas3' [Gephyromycinifex aptenodytis]
MERDYRALWAKRPERVLMGQAPYPVPAHLLDTAAVAGIVWDTVLTRRVRRLIATELTGATTEGQLATARRWVMLAAGLHDWAKATNGFLTRPWRHDSEVPWRSSLLSILSEAGFPPMNPDAVSALKNCRELRRHEFIGMCLLSPTVQGRRPSMAAASHWLPLCVGGHHGSWMDSPPGQTRIVLADASHGRWGEAQRGIAGLVSDACGVTPQNSPHLGPELAGVITVLITGIVQLSDWLASDEAVIDAGLTLIEGGADPMSPRWLEQRCQELQAHVRSCLGAYAAPADAHRAAVGTDHNGRTRGLRPLQAEAECVGDGLWFVAYPTSEGKTGAALLRHQIEDDEGLIFALPTRATTDAMQRRLEKSFAGTGNGVLLSHQFASLYRCPTTEGHGFDWFTSSTRRLLAPVVAATCDQVLAGALPQRHIPLRLLALTNHHIVLDEVHTYDRYQTTLLAALMAWWGRTGTRVTVLSATMPTWQRRILESAYTGATVGSQQTAYPAHWLAGAASPQGPALQAAVPDLHLPTTTTKDVTGAHRAWATATHERFPTCSFAIVRSRVDDAIATGRLLRADLAGCDIDVQVLHSRMTLAHRAEVEHELEARLGPNAPPGLRPLAVVATQVLDISLDVSFWSMACDLAPAASLVQRAGRLWRFLPLMESRLAKSAARPDVRALHVMIPGGGGPITESMARPYFAGELTSVAEVLAKQAVLRIPEGVQSFVDDTTYDLECSSLTDLRLAELIDASMRQEAADALAEGVLGLVDPNASVTLGTLTKATTPPQLLDGASDLEMTTRYSTLPSSTYLLVGGARGTSADVSELAAMTDSDNVRAALGSTVAVSGQALIGKLNSAAIASAPGWAPAHALLKHARPVHVDNLVDVGLTYDDTLGLTMLTEEENS